jgi:hypothetical protein
MTVTIAAVTNVVVILIDGSFSTVWDIAVVKERGAADPAGRAEDAMADKSTDPVAIWHAMLGEMEKGFNAFANRAMASPEFSKAVHQVGDVSAGAQKQIGELMEKYLAGMNLPSRSQMAGFGERLTAIENQLAEIAALLREVPNDRGAVAKTKTRRSRKPPATAAAKSKSGGPG